MLCAMKLTHTPVTVARSMLLGIRHTRTHTRPYDLRSISRFFSSAEPGVSPLASWVGDLGLRATVVTDTSTHARARVWQGVQGAEAHRGLSLKILADRIEGVRYGAEVGIEK